MAKGKGGHRKSKAPIIRTGAKIILFVDGARRTKDALEGNYKFYKTAQGAIGITKNGLDMNAFSAVAVGVAEAIGGPVAVDVVYGVVPKEIKRIKVNVKGRRPVV